MTRFLPFATPRRIVALAMACLFLAATPGFAKDRRDHQKEYEKTHKQVEKRHREDIIIGLLG